MTTSATQTRRTRKTAAAPRQRKATATAKAAEAEPKLYTIHGLDEVQIDTRVRRLDPLSNVEARELTEQIQRTSVRLWLLVTEAHDRKAHIALGYETWADYVKAELNMSESRSYQYLDTGHVMKAIASAGVDVETIAPPPTRVIARVKDRLTDVRKAAESAMRSTGDGGAADLEKAIDTGVRALAREPKPRKAVASARGSTATQTPPAPPSGGGEQADLVQCPACQGKGQVDRSLVQPIRDLLRQLRG